MASFLGAASNGFGALSIVRQAGLLLGITVSFALAFFVVKWASTPNYTPAYTQVDGRDLAPMVDALEKHDIPSKIDYSSNSILVPSSQVMKARLKMAGEGLPKQRTGKNYFFEKGSGFGKSQFVEKAAYLSSLEQELALTISQLEPIDTARVHLAVPSERSFVRQAQKPSASVFLNLQPGYFLSQKQVAAVSNLIAASIPGLSFEDVSITDQYGHPLSSRSNDQHDPSKHLETIQALEKKLSNRIINLLTPVVGAGRVRAQVNANIDFTQIEETQEIVDPDKTAIKIEKMLIEQSGDKGVLGGIPGALSNKPPAPGESINADQGQEESKDKTGEIIDTRRQATREYDVEKSIKHTVSSPYVIKQLSVAVVVDDRLSYNPESGEMERQPLTPQNIAELETLVQNAIGFSEMRGDNIKVTYNPFVQEKPIERVEVATPIWQEPWFAEAIKQVLAGLFILYIVFGVIRPLLKSLSTLDPNEVSYGGGGPVGGSMNSGANMALPDNSGAGGGAPVGNGMSDDLMPSLTLESKKDIDEVKALINDDSKRVAQVVMNWMGAVDE